MEIGARIAHYDIVALIGTGSEGVQHETKNKALIFLVRNVESDLWLVKLAAE